MRYLLALLLCLGLLSIASSNTYAADLGPGAAGVPQIEYLFSRIICLSVPGAFIALLVVLVISGIKFITSGGEAKAITASSQGITWGLLGILLLALAWLIIQLIAAFTGKDELKFFNLGILGAPGFSGSCWSAPPKAINQPRQESSQILPPILNQSSLTSNNLDIQDINLESSCFTNINPTTNRIPQGQPSRTQVRQIIINLPGGKTARLLTSIGGALPGIIFIDTQKPKSETEMANIRHAIWKLAEDQYVRNVIYHVNNDPTLKWPSTLDGMYELFNMINFRGRPPLIEANTDPDIYYSERNPDSGVSYHWADPRVSQFPAPRADFLPQYMEKIGTSVQTREYHSRKAPFVLVNNREQFIRHLEETYYLDEMRAVIKSVAQKLLNDTDHNINKYRDIFTFATNSPDFEQIFVKGSGEDLARNMNISADRSFGLGLRSNNVQDCYVTGSSPSIFIYPKSKTKMSITPSYITYADPAVINSTWTGFADTNGNFSTNNKIEFPFLYYEYTSTKVSFNTPTEGYSIPYNQWEQVITDISNQINLNKKELERLMTETLTELKQHPASAYLNIYIVPQNEINQKLPLEISPKPKNLHRLHLLIKPSNNVINLATPVIQKFERDDFTVVEIGLRYDK